MTDKPKLTDIEVREIWKIGITIYYGDDFVKINALAENADEFFLRESLKIDSGLDEYSYCKRIHSIYEQKRDKLEQFVKLLKNLDEYKNVKIEERASVIGLPLVISFEETATEIKHEFDGVIFISEIQVSRKKMSLFKAKDFLIREGKTEFYKDLGAIMSKTEFSEQFSTRTSAFTFLFFASGSINLKEKPLLTLKVKVPDEYFTIMFPTNTIESHDSYSSLMIGEKEKVKQVVAHDKESYRYLHFLKDCLGKIETDIFKMRNDLLFNSPPFFPRSSIKLLNIFSWIQSIRYSIKLHKNLEMILRNKYQIDIFRKIIEIYKSYAIKGVGFYNLRNPLSNEESGETVFSQYPIRLPWPIEIVSDNKIILKDYHKEICSFSEYPDRLISLHSNIQTLTENTLSLIKDLTSTSQLPTILFAVVIAIIALIISLFSFSEINLGAILEKIFTLIKNAIIFIF